MGRLIAWVATGVLALGAVGLAAGARAVPTPAQISYPGNGSIYLINANGTDRRVLIASRPGFRVDHWGGTAWTRDASQIAFTVGHHRAGQRYGDTLQLYLAAGDGTNVRPLKGAPRGSFDPSWSPDGTRLAFAIRQADETSIAVVGADNRRLKKIATSTDPRDFYWTPDWSPDGAWILFETSGTRRRSATRLMAVRPDGTGLHQIAALETGNHCICADWSPDGKQIAYQAPGEPLADSDYPEIWVTNADGTARVQLTRNRPRDENPDWSSDGKRIAFYSERPGASEAEIYVIPAAGGEARRVTKDPWYNGAPRWRPMG